MEKESYGERRRQINRKIDGKKTEKTKIDKDWEKERRQRHGQTHEETEKKMTKKRHTDQDRGRV